MTKLTNAEVFDYVQGRTDLSKQTKCFTLV
jgi:hypothetical protein